MRLLVSPMNLEEAMAALDGGADIIDVKNPGEGSLGANFPWAIRSVVELVAGRVPVSATIGDLPFKPGTASLAALGAAVSGADYIKAGLLGVRQPEEAIELLRPIVRSVKEHDSRRKVVAAAYSDFRRAGSLPPVELPQIAAECGADVVMVDTAIKDGRSTLEFMTVEELKLFVRSAHDLGLEAALAGNLGMRDLEAIGSISPDILGVRGAVCGGDRSTRIRAELVRALKDAL
ncbi:(5-formylfuran-3-yl)methyl phosphate synthase [Methanothrix sp.]|uniref:(5-formylfuran-3-yl)methyl phosphate synthase n=1 Tax=Methanothrix sp. TaxID=90426 RepID=UPI0034E22B1B